MEWSGEGSVVTQRRHGENAVILTVLARDAGLVSGLVPGGASAKRAAMLQPGNRLSLRWRARLEDQLGTFSVEPARARPGLIASADALAGVNAVTALLGFALPERDPHPRLSDATEALLDAMDAGNNWAEAYLLWEMRLLEEMGFGLDLTSCAVTGTREGLAYVSPRTGRAVSRKAGEPYKDRLLPLPPFMLSAQTGLAAGDVKAGLDLTAHFLELFVFGPLNRPLPPARVWLVDRLTDAQRL